MSSVTEQALLILTTLVDQPRHGYGIVGEVAELSEGRVALRVGTLYGVLDRLVSEGLVEPDREEVHQGRLRRYYRLTDQGGAVLDEETERQAAILRTVTSRLRAHRPAVSRA